MGNFFKRALAAAFVLRSSCTEVLNVFLQKLVLPAENCLQTLHKVKTQSQ